MAIGWRSRSRSMAISPCFSCSLSLLITLAILSHMIMVANGKSSCTLHACRANVANECCCKAIRNEIANENCASLCFNLRSFDSTPRLVSECRKNWKCRECTKCTLCKGRTDDFYQKKKVTDDDGDGDQLQACRKDMEGIGIRY